MNRGNLTTKDAIRNYRNVLKESKTMLKNMQRKSFDYGENSYKLQSSFQDLIYVSRLMLYATEELGEIEDKKNKVVITTMDKSRSDEIWHHSGAVVATTMEGNNE